MALIEGPVKGTILKNYLDKDGKGQTFVNLKFSFQDDEQTLYHRIYITPKSAGIARGKLRKCGFDLDKQKLSEIEQNDVLLCGNEVDVVLVKNGQYMNIDIPTERPKLKKEEVDSAQAMLDSAKKDEGDQDNADIPF